MIVLILCLFCLLVVALNVVAWPRLGPVTPSPAGGRVAVLIPMRNEEANIARCLKAVGGAGDMVVEIIVYDDHSTDRGPEFVRSAAAEDPRISMLAPEPLPEGWYGKPFACSRLAAAAEADWLLFIDADVNLLPGTPARMVTEALKRDVSLLSCWPGLDMCSLPEKVFLPLLNFVVLTLFPTFMSLRDMRPSLGLAHGACILLRKDACDRTGGHAMVRAELFEDTALARAWRDAGQRGVCLDGQDVVRVRMYDRFAAMWQGFTKNAYPAFRHELSFWLFIALHGLVFTAPFVVAPLLALTGGPWSVWAGAAACTLVMRLLLAARFRHPWWSAVLHPVASAVMCAVALYSWQRCRTGKGVAWKGRTYRNERVRDAT